MSDETYSPKTYTPPTALKQPTTEEIQTSEESVSLKEQLLNSGLEESLIIKLNNLVYYTSKVGLPLEDACKLASIEYDEFKKLIERNEILRGILEKKELEYKKDLLYTLSAKARSGDDKLAQWLLERRFPEFSTKGKGSTDEADLLAMAVSFIQKSGDSQPLINEASGKAIVIHKGAGDMTWKEKFKTILK